MTNPNQDTGPLVIAEKPRVECDCCHSVMVRATARGCRKCGYGPMCKDCIADDPCFRREES
mgnify:CR=1 FL=1